MASCCFIVLCLFDVFNTVTCCPLRQGFKCLHSLCVCARVFVHARLYMRMATDAGSVAPSHLTREEQERDAAERRER